MSIKLMTQTMDGCLILNNLQRSRVKLCQKVTAALQRQNVRHFYHFFFKLPHPNFAPKIAWAR